MLLFIEHDADNVREVLLEAGAKNPRIVEIEGNARRVFPRLDAALKSKGV